MTVARFISVGQTKIAAPGRVEIIRAALVTFALGAGLVFLAGFAYPSAAHNAAHDTRHSLSFPCH